MGLERKTERNRVTVISMGRNQGVNKDGSTVRCDRWTEPMNVTKCDVTYVCLKRKCAVKNNTQTLDL